MIRDTPLATGTVDRPRRPEGAGQALSERDRQAAGARPCPYELLAAQGAGDYIGEPVSQLAHALQCAAQAERAHASDVVVAAALFHDIGHLCSGPQSRMMDGLGVVDHESVGAQLLVEAGYPREVCELVRGHVEAKRYLTATNQAYAQRLSVASRMTLTLQGGAMSKPEVARFRSDPLRQHKLRLRAWDEMSKDPNAAPPPLAYYQVKLAHLVY